MIEAAKSLVPDQSEVQATTDNSNGLPFEVGDYWAALDIDDGGLGEGLLEAVELRAAAEGWEERYRCDTAAGVKLGYSRDVLKVDISVRVNNEPADARIRVQRLDEGNPWPPDC